MSDNLSARWNRILMTTNKDTSEEVVIARSSYDDFSQPTAWRSYEIVCGDRVFYVNAGWLAELSPYFADIIFTRKPTPKRYQLEGSSPVEVLEFLRCITFCPMRKPLSVKNVSLVLTFANRFEMRPVQARCEHFIACNAQTLSRDKAKLFQVTCAMSQCDPNSSTMSVLVDRLAAIKDDDLSRLQFADMPGDVVAEVFAQKIQRSKEKNNRRNQSDSGCCVLSMFRSLFRRRHSRNRTLSTLPIDQQSTVPAH
uniref:BTB domain-containing protein n=1 Tax=Caenorhabditis angaria TaxID=860376 RepID=B6VBW7_9PELO|nr:hypothetical protein Csp3_JD04.009 [Caenorhabditis angaria]